MWLQNPKKNIAGKKVEVEDLRETMYAYKFKVLLWLFGGRSHTHITNNHAKPYLFYVTSTKVPLDDGVSQFPTKKLSWRNSVCVDYGWCFWNHFGVPGFQFFFEGQKGIIGFISLNIKYHYNYLVVSTNLKNISQIGSFPRVGVKIKPVTPPRSLTLTTRSQAAVSDDICLQCKVLLGGRGIKMPWKHIKFNNSSKPYAHIGLHRHVVSHMIVVYRLEDQAGIQLFSARGLPLDSVKASLMFLDSQFGIPSSIYDLSVRRNDCLRASW